MGLSRKDNPLDITTLWPHLWPYITMAVAVASTLDAVLPQPAPGSHWLILRKLISFVAVNVAHASNGAQPSFVTWIVRIAAPVLQAQGVKPAEPVTADPAPQPSPSPVAGVVGALLLAVLIGLGMSACANMQDPTTVVVSAESTYAAYMAAENTYLASGKADPKVVKILSNARTGVASVLDPLAAAAAKGQAPTSDQALAVNTALAAFQQALQANGLMPKPTTGSN